MCRLYITTCGQIAAAEGAREEAEPIRRQQGRAVRCACVPGRYRVGVGAIDRSGESGRGDGGSESGGEGVAESGKTRWDSLDRSPSIACWPGLAAPGRPAWLVDVLLLRARGLRTGTGGPSCHGTTRPFPPARPPTDPRFSREIITRADPTPVRPPTRRHPYASL